jgi:putative transposase
MKKSRFTAEQIAMALRQAEAGTPIAEICRSLQITEQTFYRWKKKYGSLGTPEIRELRQLREENKKLKQLVADLTLDKHILQESLKKSTKTPGAARVGGVGQGCVPGVGSPGMSGERICEIEHRVSLSKAAAGSVAETDTGARRGSDQLRISSLARAAETRRVADQREAGVPAVPGRRSWAEAEEAETAASGRRPAGEADGGDAERAVGDGFYA